MNKDIVQVTPERFTETVRETSLMLLDYFEDNGRHQSDEVTHFLVLLSKIDYIEKSFLVDFAEYTSRED